MSRENVEIVRRLYEAMDARDTKVIADLAHPAIEWVPDERVGEGPARGIENVIQFFMDRAEMFEGLRTEMERLWGQGYGDRDEALEAVGLRE